MKNILRLIIVLFFAFFIQMQAISKDVTITVISDAHIKSDKKDNTMTPSIAKLLKAIEQTNIDSSDYVIFLGDNVQNADRVDTAMFSKIIKKLNKPYYTVIGNRDISKTRGMDKKEYFRIVNKFSSNKTSKMPCYKRADDLIFIFLSCLSCSNLPTDIKSKQKLKDRAGRYSLNVNFVEDIKLDFVVFDTGNINFIGSRNNIANNLGTYFLGDPESTNKTFSFDIKETINGVEPNTYFIDFFIPH